MAKTVIWPGISDARCPLLLGFSVRNRPWFRRFFFYCDAYGATRFHFKWRCRPYFDYSYEVRPYLVRFSCFFYLPFFDDFVGTHPLTIFRRWSTQQKTLKSRVGRRRRIRFSRKKISKNLKHKSCRRLRDLKAGFTLNRPIPVVFIIFWKTVGPVRPKKFCFEPNRSCRKTDPVRCDPCLKGIVEKGIKDIVEKESPKNNAEISPKQIKRYVFLIKIFFKFCKIFLDYQSGWKRKKNWRFFALRVWTARCRSWVRTSKRTKMSPKTAKLS